MCVPQGLAPGPHEVLRIGLRIVAGAHTQPRVIEKHVPASLPVRHALDHRPVLAGDLDRSDVEDAEVLDGLGQPVENSSRQQS